MDVDNRPIEQLGRGEPAGPSQPRGLEDYTVRRPWELRRLQDTLRRLRASCSRPVSRLNFFAFRNFGLYIRSAAL